MIVKSTIAAILISSVVAADAASQGRPTGETYALIVSGIGKDPEDRLTKDRVVNDLGTYLLEKAQVEPNRLAVLVPDADAAGVSTAGRIKETIDAFSSAMTPADRFILYYIGQANAIGDTLRFNLPGPDLTHEDLARLLAGVKAGKQLVVLDCPYAGTAAKALARSGRVVLLGATAKQAGAPQFGRHFVPALGRIDSDTNHDGRVSVLEAFTAAARQIEQWYQQMQLLPTETPGLEDNGDGIPSERPWRYEQDGGDGRIVAELFLEASDTGSQ